MPEPRVKGNRLMHRVDNDASRRWYCANNVNQYTAIDDEASTCPTPSTPVAEFAYDADGNLLSDGTRQYTWDAENRLIGAAPGSPGAGAKKVAFGYDYMGRRVRKAVYAWDTGGSQWESTPMLDERYVYDGWNVVLVLDGNASNAVTRRYTWGLDLSGLGGNGSASGIHGAGGIGGLLAVVETQGTATTADDEHFWFLYDGNGNVGQLLRYDAQANPPVTLAAHYEYDPYGQTLTVHDADSSGYAAANPLRFSTKWFDAETGLGYWGYRYYTPDLGRWMGRDPIEEQGGLNLYVFVANMAVGSFDPTGLSSFLDRLVDWLFNTPEQRVGCWTRSFDLGAWLAFGTVSHENSSVSEFLNRTIRFVNRINLKLVFQICKAEDNPCCLNATGVLQASGTIFKAGVIDVSVIGEGGGSMRICRPRQIERFSFYGCGGVGVTAKFNAWVVNIAGNATCKACLSSSADHPDYGPLFGILTASGSVVFKGWLWDDKFSWATKRCLFGDCKNPLFE